MLDFYKWAAENFYSFAAVTVVLVLGAVWVIEALEKAFKKDKDV